MLRRSNKNELYCVIVKQRYGHVCQYSWIAVSLIQWDGLSRDLADIAYDTISSKTSKHGTETERMCGANKKKTCACQGLDSDVTGASYTFGCSWSMYVNVCKFCRSGPNCRKFKLNKVPEAEEKDFEKICNELSDNISPAFARLAPDCFNNMCLFESVAEDCRIGSRDTLGNTNGRPFSGITMVCDFCAHAHKDTNNMVGGCTVVVSLTRPENRDVMRPDDEQYHVLPQYVPDASQEELEAAIEDGGMEVLSKFVRTITIRDTPKRAQGCKRGKPNAEKKKLLDGYIPSTWNTESPVKKESPTKAPRIPKEPKPPKPPKEPKIPKLKSPTKKVKKKNDSANIGQTEAQTGIAQQNFDFPFSSSNYVQDKYSHPTYEQYTDPSNNTWFPQHPSHPDNRVHSGVLNTTSNGQSRNSIFRSQNASKPHSSGGNIPAQDNAVNRNLNFLQMTPMPQRTITLSNPVLYRPSAQAQAPPYIPNVPKVAQVTNSQQSVHYLEPRQQQQNYVQHPQQYGHQQQQNNQYSQPHSNVQQYQYQPYNQQPHNSVAFDHRYGFTSQPHNHSAYNVIQSMEQSFSDEMMQLLEPSTQQQQHQQQHSYQHYNIPHNLPQVDGTFDTEPAQDIYSAYLSQNMQEQTAAEPAVDPEPSIPTAVASEELTPHYRIPAANNLQQHITPQPLHNSTVSSIKSEPASFLDQENINDYGTSDFSFGSNYQSSLNLMSSNGANILGKDSLIPGHNFGENLLLKPEIKEDLNDIDFPIKDDPDYFPTIKDDLDYQPQAQLKPETSEAAAKVSSYQTECLEAFCDPAMGGLALALPHGSILVEVAKHELHATTALLRPNRHQPVRIGLVFYQHKSLHFPQHGHQEYVRKTEIREFRDYLQWLGGNYTPTSHKLSSLTKAGFMFPEGVRTVKGSQEATQEEKFQLSDHPDFVPGKLINGELFLINPVTDTSYDVFKAKINQRNQDASCLNMEPPVSIPPADGSQIVPNQMPCHAFT